MTGKNPNGSSHRSALILQFHLIGKYSSVLAATRPNFVGKIQRGGRSGADDSRVVPGESGQRLGQLLQPAVVGKGPVVNLRIRAEKAFQLPGGAGRRSPGAGGWRRNP